MVHVIVIFVKYLEFAKNSKPQIWDLKNYETKELQIFLDFWKYLTCRHNIIQTATMRPPSNQWSFNII